MSVTNKSVLYNAMVGTKSPIYTGFIGPQGNQTTFQAKWADIADLLFKDIIPVSGSAVTARAAFITALAHAVYNEGIRGVIENAFLAYINTLESAMTVGTFTTPLKPTLSDMARLESTMAQIESNQWLIDTISASLNSWAILYTAVPTLPDITGVPSIYLGSNPGSKTYANTVSGGVWTSGTPAKATIVAGTGVATAVAAGTSVITYTITNEFGYVNTTTLTITVLTLAVITGASSVAALATIQLADATVGGTWSSSDPTKATVSVGGLVTGVAAGTTDIKYLMADGAYVLKTITVTP